MDFKLYKYAIFSRNILHVSIHQGSCMFLCFSLQTLTRLSQLYRCQLTSALTTTSSTQRVFSPTLRTTTCLATARTQSSRSSTRSVGTHPTSQESTFSLSTKLFFSPIFLWRKYFRQYSERFVKLWIHPDPKKYLWIYQLEIIMIVFAIHVGLRNRNCSKRKSRLQSWTSSFGRKDYRLCWSARRTQVRACNVFTNKFDWNDTQ